MRDYLSERNVGNSLALQLIESYKINGYVVAGYSRKVFLLILTVVTYGVGRYKMCPVNIPKICNYIFCYRCLFFQLFSKVKYQFCI